MKPTSPLAFPTRTCPRATAWLLSTTWLASTAWAQGPLIEIGFSQFGGSTALGGQVASDGAGGAFLCGSASGQLGGQSFGSSDVILARFDAAGNRTWTRQFGSSSVDRPYAMIPDGAGGVFLCGDTQGDLAGTLLGQSDSFIARYDAAGQQQWIRQAGTAQFDTLRGLAPDGAGGVYALGLTGGDYAGPFLGGNSDGILLRFDSSGNVLFGVQFGTSEQDTPQGIAIDGAGGLFVTGFTVGQFPGVPAGAGSAFLARFDAGGALTWVEQFGSSPSLENPTVVTADGAGGAFVAGTSLVASSTGPVPPIDGFVAHFDSSGTRLWQAPYTTGDPLQHTRLTAIETLPSGEVLVAGTTLLGDILVGPSVLYPTDGFLHRLSPQGTPLSTTPIASPGEDAINSAVLNGNAGIWVGGITSGSLGGPIQGFYDFFLGRFDFEVGTAYCAPAVPNSTGQPARITAAGSEFPGDNALTLLASDLPPNQFGYFLNSRTTASVPGAGGGQGTLCLGGSVGRYNRATQVGDSGAAGKFQLMLDLGAMPTPTGLVPAISGETWHFQAWYRDGNPAATTNFTSAVSVSLH